MVELPCYLARLRKRSGLMALSIENPVAEQLADEGAMLTGENKTKAIRKTLDERRSRLRFRLTGDDPEAPLRRSL